jgi:MFS family permease
VRSKKDDAFDEEMSIGYYGWRVVFAGFVMAIVAWGVGFYGPSIYLVELTRQNGWPTTLISSATTFYYLLSSVLMVFVDSFVRKLGPKVLASIGVSLLAASLGAFGVLSQPWQLFLVYSVLALGWTATSIAGISCVVGPWFNRRRGMAISLAMNGGSIGGIVAAPLLAWTAASYGFAAATRLGGISILCVALPVVFLLVRRPPERILHPSGAGVGTNIDVGTTRMQALKNWHFWTIAGPSALALIAQVGFLFHMVAIVESILDRGDAAKIVSLTALGALTGRLALGNVIDRLQPRKVGAVCVATQAMALIVLANSHERFFIYASCITFGLSVGSILMVPIVTIQREMHPASFGLLVGLSSAIAQFAFSIGPGALGLLKDLTGTYDLPLAFCVTLEAASCLFVLLGPRMFGHARLAPEGRGA